MFPFCLDFFILLKWRYYSNTAKSTPKTVSKMFEIEIILKNIDNIDFAYSV